MKCELTGIISLVTGAAQGIGQAIADRLAANGSRVFYTDVDAAGAANAAARSPLARSLKLDVTRPDDFIEPVGFGPIAANLVATVIRFVLYRTWVFGKSRPNKSDADKGESIERDHLRGEAFDPHPPAAHAEPGPAPAARV